MLEIHWEAMQWINSINDIGKNNMAIQEKHTAIEGQVIGAANNMAVVNFVWFTLSEILSRNDN